MKKTFKIIFINILLLFIAFFVIDISLFIKDTKFHTRDYVYVSPKLFFKYYINLYKRAFYTKQNYDKIFITELYDYFAPLIYMLEYREPMNVESDRPPVLMLGCSFAYGTRLEPEQTLMRKIADLTDRPMYNRALSAHGLNEMLYQFRSEEFYSIVPKPEWVIYIFIPDQIRRTLMPCSMVDLGIFYDKNLNLKHDINFPIVYKIKEKVLMYKKRQHVDFALSILGEIKSEAQKHWGDDVKFFFLYYYYDDDLWQYMKPRLENEGFVVSTVKDLVHSDILMTKEYKVEDKIHPTEEAWGLLAPAIVDKINL